MKRYLSIGLVVVVALAAAWGGWRHFRRQPPETQAIRNVVLISIDTCRADRLGCYGYARPSTPNIDAIARDGALFLSALSPVPATTPAHCSMLSGSYPPTHGVRMNNGERLADANVTLAETLKKAGYRTGAFVGGFPVDARFGLSQGFDTYDGEYTRKRFPDMPADERTAEEVSRPALAWLDKNAGQPFFLFLHYYDAHLPYAPPPPYASNFADDLYAGEIAYVDHWIGQVMDRLRAMGAYDDTLVIVTADHGESLGEHGETSHGFFVYQGTMHVPLVVRSPHAPAGRKVEGDVSLVDIVPTVLDLAGLKTPSQVQGVSLRKCLHEGAAPARSQPIYGESLWPATYDCGALHSVVEGPWKYIRSPRQELYDLSQDLAEKNNLSDKEPKVAQRLRDRLETALRDMEAAAPQGGPSTVDPEAIKRLQGLGYMSGGSAASSSAFDPKREDPKDFVSTHEALMTLCRPDAADRPEETRKGLLEIIRTRPRLITAQAMLATLAVKAGRPAEAVGYCENIVAILAESKASPRSLPPDAGNLAAGPFDTRDLARAHFNLALVLKESGRIPEAAGHYEEALQINPDYADAHVNLGAIAQQAGNGPEAIAHYEQALRIRPDAPEAHGNLAMVLQHMGRLPEAMGHYDQALRLKPDYAQNNPAFASALAAAREATAAIERYQQVLLAKPDDPEAHTELGNVLGQIGRPEEAIGHYEQALRVRPDSPQAHYNLAMACAATGKPARAIEQYRQALRLAPDFALAMNNLAWLLATQAEPGMRDGAEAVRLAGRACQLAGRKDAGLLDTLAAAYAEAGRFPDAVATAQEAVALARSANQPAAVNDIQSRLSLYREGKCYREVAPRPAAATRP